MYHATLPVNLCDRIKPPLSHTLLWCILLLKIRHWAREISLEPNTSFISYPAIIRWRELPKLQMQPAEPHDTGWHYLKSEENKFRVIYYLVHLALVSDCILACHQLFRLILWCHEIARAIFKQNSCIETKNILCQRPPQQTSQNTWR